MSRTTDRGEWDAVSGSGRDPVDCTVFAPSRAAPSETFLVQVLAHRPEREEDARRIAEEADEGSRRAGSVSLGTELEAGSVLTIELVLPGLTVDEPVQTLTWRGRTDSTAFGVSVPSGASPGPVVGRVLVSQASVPIGIIRFKLRIVGGRQQADDREPIGEAHRYRQAFISYASPDRSEVLRRVAMLRLVGIRCFQDVLSLDPGEPWERRLYESIDHSDVLFLFWSTAARDSEWVTREWRYGLERKGEEFIRPVIIEGPPFPQPPPELAHLNFADSIQCFVAASERS
ncbi:MAG: toll/interleukin-1 receptor domain-containing protein [Actinomycetota bacterium]